MTPEEASGVCVCGGWLVCRESIVNVYVIDLSSIYLKTCQSANHPKIKYLVYCRLWKLGIVLPKWTTDVLITYRTPWPMRG